MFEKILIAGRGESALRILRSCRELGIQAVAAHSEADELAMHVRFADESVCIGPAPARESYLNQAAVISAAPRHRGPMPSTPGSVSSPRIPTSPNASAPTALAFIGPSHEHIRTMGDKIAARRRAEELGLPVVPGSEGALADAAQAAELAASFGYPVLLKAAAGGGGRGMQIVEDPARLEAAWNLASGEAKSAFGDGRLYLEKFIRNPRHIEVQILGDGKGSARPSRRARLLHPTPQPEGFWKKPPRRGFDRRATPAHRASLRRRHARDGLRATAGTLEFVFDGEDFYFIEMNTRLQVEHPITEALTGLDLVREQILIAAGEPLSFAQEAVSFRGQAIECRINAERSDDFRPLPRRCPQLPPLPGAWGVRMDSALYSGYRIPLHYDSLVAKLVVHGQDRPHAVARLARALGELVVDGVDTTIPLFQAIARRRRVPTGHLRHRLAGTPPRSRPPLPARGLNRGRPDHSPHP